MNRTTLKFGALLGAAGGMAMAMWSMIVLAATGHGFLTPVNLIAHAIWRGAPLDGAFSAGALVLGLMVHMMLSMMLGAGIAAAATRPGISATNQTVIALVVPMAAWAGQLVIWEAVDQAGHAAFTPWVLFVGHAMFAMVAAAGLALRDRRSDAAPLRIPAHA